MFLIRDIEYGLFFQLNNTYDRLDHMYTNILYTTYDAYLVSLTNWL